LIVVVKWIKKAIIDFSSDGSSPIPPMNMAMKQVREDLAKHFGMALDLNSPVYSQF
jgi:hypothetical protein